MSTAHASHHAHASHDNHAFDGEPAHTLPADEPPSPGWLPVLGFALFLVSAVAFLATRDAHPAPQSPTQKVGELAPSPAAPQHAVEPAPSRGDAQRFAPEQMREIQKRLAQLKGQQGAPPAPAK